MKICKVLLLSVLWCLSPLATAEKLYVAVAANFSHTMQKLVAEFEQTSTYNVNVTFGSSGKFYAQIKQGAPYHLFLSADQIKPQTLEAQNEIVQGSRFTYAVGRLALWSTRPELFKQVESQFKNNAFTRIALANPKVAPYGIAATQVLDTLQLTELTQTKWVLGENVAQTYQFVGTGNADLGFVAYSQLLANPNIQAQTYWLIPDSLHQPIRQDAVLLKRAKHNPAANALFEFLQSDKAKMIISRYGYDLSHTYKHDKVTG